MCPHRRRCPCRRKSHPSPESSQKSSGEDLRSSGDNVAGASPESSQESPGEDLATMWPERLQRALRRAPERIWRQCDRNVSRELSGELWRGSGVKVAGTSPESSQESSGEDLATMWPEPLQGALRRALERIWRQCGRNVSRELSEELRRGDQGSGEAPSNCSFGGRVTWAPPARPPPNRIYGGRVTWAPPA